MANERDTHFQGFANLQYPELARLFLALYTARVLGDEQQAKQAAQMIKEYLAQRAYDLAYHALYCNGVEAWYRPGKDYPNPSVKYERKVTEHTNDVPDLKEWPVLPDPTQQAMWREETILATDLSECPEPE